MLTEKEILQFIRDDMSSDRKRYAREGLKYYEGDHDIRNHNLYYFNADGTVTFANATKTTDKWELVVKVYAKSGGRATIAELVMMVEADG